MNKSVKSFLGWVVRVHQILIPCHFWNCWYHIFRYCRLSIKYICGDGGGWPLHHVTLVRLTGESKCRNDREKTLIYMMTNIGTSNETKVFQLFENRCILGIYQNSLLAPCQGKMTCVINVGNDGSNHFILYVFRNTRVYYIMRSCGVCEWNRWPAYHKTPEEQRFAPHWTLE